MREELDKRTTGYKRRMESMIHKPDAVVQMLERALKAGISADYVLMDSWFTHAPLFQKLMDKGLHVSGMVKEFPKRVPFWFSTSKRNPL